MTIEAVSGIAGGGRAREIRVVRKELHEFMVLQHVDRFQCPIVPGKVEVAV